MSTLSTIIVIWLAASVAATVGWIVMYSLRTRYGTVGNFFKYLILKARHKQ